LVVWQRAGRRCRYCQVPKDVRKGLRRSINYRRRTRPQSLLTCTQCYGAPPSGEPTSPAGPKKSKITALFHPAPPRMANGFPVERCMAVVGRTAGRPGDRAFSPSTTRWRRSPRRPIGAGPFSPQRCKKFLLSRLSNLTSALAWLTTPARMVRASVRAVVSAGWRAAVSEGAIEYVKLCSPSATISPVASTRRDWNRHRNR